jgi:hypothetical protein
MTSNYLCKGCLRPIHWFCSEGDPAVNETLQHGAHYMCLPCTSSKGAKKKQGAVLQESRAKQLAIADKRKKVIARKSGNANRASGNPPRTSPRKGVASDKANPASEHPPRTSPQKGVASDKANPAIDFTSPTSPRKGKESSSRKRKASDNVEPRTTTIEALFLLQIQQQ